MAIPQEIETRVREIYQELFDANYSSGATRIPPHTHNGVDNLQINASNILNLPTGGGTPGGANTQVQFNNNGAFGANPEFSFDQTLFTLYVPNISNTTLANLDGNNQQLQIFQLSVGNAANHFKIFTTNADPVNIGSDSDNLDISTGDAQAGVGKAGDILIKTGTGLTGGDINITAGPVTGFSGGNINITAGSSSGSIFLSSAFVGMVSRTVLVLSATSDDGNGIVSFQARNFSGNPNTACYSFSQGGVSGSSAFGDGIGVIFIEDATTAPSSNPSGGGIFYSTGGALHWLGSSGTDTIIAPA